MNDKKAEDKPKPKPPLKVRTWSLRARGKVLTIVRRSDVPVGRREECEPLPAVSNLLDEWLRDPAARGQLSDMLGGAGDHDLRNLREQIARLFDGGHLVALKEDPRTTSTKGAAAPPPAPPPPPPPPPAPTAPKKQPKKEQEPELSWVRIELVDEDGNLLEGEAFELTLSSGARKNGNWSAAGVFEQDIPEGTCKIKFPKLHKNGWTAPGSKKK